MRIKFISTLAIAMMTVASPTFAELQNVEVGGSLKIRYNAYSESTLTGSDSGANDEYTEMRATVSLTADFTDDVSVFLEMSTYDAFGSAADATIDGARDLMGGAIDSGVVMHQAYIETRESWGMPLTIRTGRQEIQLGSEWLIGNNDTGAQFVNVSFDGMTVMYDADSFNLTGAALKLADADALAGTGLGGFGGDEDSDTDLYILYGSYTGLENIVLDGYYMWVRDAASSAVLADERSDLHTFGVRVAGNVNALDFEAELAFQTGELNQAGTVNGALALAAGGGDADYDGLAFNAELGYTFDSSMQPRLWGGVAYFEGHDAGGDLGFDRLFSDWEYSEFLDNGLTNNMIVYRLGVDLQATESVSLSAVLAAFEVEDDDTSAGNPAGSPDEDLGFELDLYVTYDYSEDLQIEFGYAHFFADDGLGDTHVIGDGLGAITGNGAGDDDDADYFYVQSSISF